LIVECAGFKEHGRRLEQIERDNERAAELTADGWALLQFSWHQINKRSAWVASRIRRTLMQRRAQLGLAPESGQQ
jgi:very-short-patch-repair endonuclease